MLEKMTGFCSRIPKWLSYIYSMIVVMIGWVFFRSEDLGSAMTYLGYMFGLKEGVLGNMEVFRRLTPQCILFMVLSVIASTPVVRKISDRIKWGWTKDAAVIVVFLLRSVIWLQVIIIPSFILGSDL